MSKLDWLVIGAIAVGAIVILDKFKKGTSTALAQASGEAVGNFAVTAATGAIGGAFTAGKGVVQSVDTAMIEQPLIISSLWKASTFGIRGVKDVLTGNIFTKEWWTDGGFL